MQLAEHCFGIDSTQNHSAKEFHTLLFPVVRVTEQGGGILRLVSVVTPCFNEEENIQLVYERVKSTFKEMVGLEYEHIFADNCSQDSSLNVLRGLCVLDSRVKVIVNAKNFGPTRSVFNALLAARGDAVVLLACDLQDPPELIQRFIAKWLDGYEVVFGIRERREEPFLISYGRRLYYRLISSVSEDDLVKDAGDFFLIDRRVQQVLRRIQDRNPYIRGLLASLGFKTIGIPYHMSSRHSGRSNASPYSLFVLALSGFVNHTLLPLRLATLSGLMLSFLCMGYALLTIFMRLIGSSDAPAGTATIVVALFFLSGVQLFLLGFLGEFVGAIYRQQKGLPLVVERERINF